MRSIIDRKAYDTEKATLLAKDWNGLGCGDFRFFLEELYITKNGSFFLYGSGGAESIYSDSNGRDSWGTSGIYPLSKNEAFEWMQKNDEDELIDEYFNDLIIEA